MSVSFIDDMCGRQGEGVMTATVSISSFKHSAKGHKQNEEPIRPYDLFTYLEQKNASV